MSKFYKKIKEHPSVNKELEIPSGAWGSFSNYKEEKEKDGKSSPSLLPWLLGAAAGLLLFSNIFTFLKLQENEITGVVRTDNSKSISSKSISTTSTDTVYIIKYVDSENEAISAQQFKSLLQTSINQRKALSSATSKVNSMEREIMDLKEQFIFSELANNDKLPSWIGKESQNYSPNEITERSVDQESSPSIDRQGYRDYLYIPQLDLMASLTSLDTRHLLPTKSYALAMWKSSSRKKNLLEYLSPKSFFASLNVGGIFPSGGNDIIQGPGFDAGLGIGTRFSDHLSISLDAAAGVLYKISNGYDANGNIPKIEAPTNGKLDHIDIKQNIFKALLGLKYAFVPSKKVNPYLGIGFGFASLQSPSFKYKFESNLGELYITKENHSISNSYSFLNASTGVNYRISPTTQIQLGLGYSQSLSEGLNNYFVNASFVYEIF